MATPKEHTGDIKMKTVIKTQNAPAAIGAYSQATVYNGLIYVSGQLPIDPATGELIQDDIGKQTEMAMSNVAAIIKAAGSSMDNMLKTTILLTDLSHFAQVNEAYGKFFDKEPPARACYQVVALPKGAEVEIEAVCGMN